MGNLTKLVTAAVMSLTLTSYAQEATPEYQNGFISDELFIFMHSGAGNNYRIIGSINAGTQIKLTGESENNYTQIIDDKERTAWVESKYVSLKPGLRHVVAELNGQLATTGEQEARLSSQINENSKKLAKAEQLNIELTNKITTLESQLTSAEAKLETQDMDIKKEWFFNGSIVMGIGILLGLVITRLPTRRKSSMDSWS